MKVYHSHESALTSAVPGQAGSFYSVSEIDIKSNTVGSRLHSVVDSMKANAIVVESRVAVIEAGNHGKRGLEKLIKRYRALVMGE